MRILLAVMTTIFLALPAFAEYTIILKDGTTYRAQDKWKVVENGQAVVTLVSGTQIKFDARLIDVHRTEETNRLGLGDARLIKVEDPAPASETPQRSLGSITTLKKDDRDRNPAATENPQRAATAPSSPTGSRLGKEILGKFERAYDNVGLFGATVEPLNTNELKIAVTTNNEDEVFKAISATAFLVANLPGIEQVTLLMSTLNGGSAGKFQMSRGDAKALSDKHINWQSYYVQKVIY